MKLPVDRFAEVILDSVADGVFTVDKRWRISSFNAAAERITGTPRREAIGKPCCEVFRANICESDCALRQTMESGRPVANRQVYIVNARGERVPISVATALLKDRKGVVIGGVETFRDLSVVEELRKEISSRRGFGDIVGKSAAMRRVFDILPEIAESGSSVLIQGESGSGKELVARALHELSPRRKGPFVAVSCGAVPDALLASELFGHVAGAFTDAKRSRPGRFAKAEGGTLFLDEIGDVSPAMQAQLLRVLQEREYEPLGSSDTLKADVRIVAATHRDLKALTEEGRFREDLYYRIRVVAVNLPPLRERREDIPLLLDHFIARFNRLRDRNAEGASDEVMAILMSHPFPGNVRELENIVEHAFVLCRGPTIEAAHLPVELRQGPDSPGNGAAEGGLAAMERQEILRALERHGGKRIAAARELGIHKTTLWRKMKKMGLA